LNKRKKKFAHLAKGKEVPLTELILKRNQNLNLENVGEGARSLKEIP